MQERQVATRSTDPNSKTTTNKSFQANTLHYARAAMPGIKVRLPGFMVATTSTSPTGTGQELANGGTINYRCGVENSSGTVLPITFSGSLTGTCTDGSYIDSDMVALPTGFIKKNSWFRLRPWGQSATGFVFTSHTGLTNCAAMGDVMNVHATAATDLTAGGVVTNNVASTCMFYPLGIYSNHSEPAVLLWGDSRVAGQNDTMDARGDIGELARSIGPKLAYTNCSTPSDRVNWMISNYTNRIQLAAKHTDCILQGIINDLNNGRTSAQGLADAATLRAALKAVNPSIRIFQTTAAPWATGTTDAYATTVNQTIPAWSAAQRVPYNNAVRGGRLANCDGYIDLADIAESARDSTFWTPLHTNDGGHAVQLGALAVERSGIVMRALGY